MDGLGTVACVAQRLGAILGAVLRAREHDHAVGALLLQQRLQKLGLLEIGDGHHELLDRLGGLAVAGDFHDGRVVQQRAQVLLDGVVDGGREEQRLAIGGGGVYDGGDGGQEAHVKHAVRFVQHEGLDAAEVDDAFVHEVVQAAGRGDEHVGAASDLVDLGAVGRTAEHGGHVVPRLAGDLHARLRDLLRQLTGGADHQHAGRALAPLAARQGAQDGQQERGGLTRAGAGGGDEVAAFQDQRDGLQLHRGGVLVAQAFDGGKGSLRQAEVGEILHYSFPFLFVRARCALFGRTRSCGVHCA